ncbi:UDP-N-acetylglucosamine--N-acetylmuramyl-(pentapeptide) pyrophosphoryl-undecaprenol N-acetylglucosamine transferase [Candidatus Gracilibacteria bacterium]|nr:UDP-N-acetylglucosamine--N-acetylmuramyl-(pentapeptide) pyrophosphoryl-undecaprenol N-acetylglucosamine transferase [Candidatus Gracilibacteria bacterium]
MTKKVLFIGGGTGGHIYPLRNLVDELIKNKAQVEVVVADQKLDREIIKENFADLTVHYFKTGKIRRYLSLQNFLDISLIIKSFFTARDLLKRVNPDVIFFKGGFVGFPFLIAAKFLINFHGQIFSHESDISPGFLTKLATKYSDETFHSFGQNPKPLFYTPLSKEKSPEHSNRIKKLLFFGGSQGAQFINDLFTNCHDKILKDYQVTLVTGPGKKISLNHPNLQQYELLSVEKLAQEIKTSDLVVARAGANSLFEIIAAKKPSIIIPLPSVARNHQLKNAMFFKKKGLCSVLEQKDANPNTLLDLITETMNDEKIKKSLDSSNIRNSAAEIAQKILS